MQIIYYSNIPIQIIIITVFQGIDQSSNANRVKRPPTLALEKQGLKPSMELCLSK